MKRFLSMLLCSIILISGCANNVTMETSPETIQTVVSEKHTGYIYLYGEQHGEPVILEKELELWQSYYHDQGLRHLFVEYGYFTGAYLNLWMKAEDDAILNALFSDWEGTQGHNEAVLTFYKEIKKTCPETVFHGTDIGHQYWSTGARYLEYLEQAGLADSEEYGLAQEAIEQGIEYYTVSAAPDTYREKTMSENFIRAFDALDGESAMGIFGSAHTDPNSLNHTGQCDSMAKLIQNHYGSSLICEDLTQLLLAEKAPEAYETISVNGKAYTAEYFGKQDLSALIPEYSYREFWRLQNAYEDFCTGTFTGNVLPQNNYPMQLEAGQAYLVKYTLADGSVRIEYHLCDGSQWNGNITTKEIKLNRMQPRGAASPWQFIMLFITEGRLNF